MSDQGSATDQPHARRRLVATVAAGLLTSALTLAVPTASTAAPSPSNAATHGTYKLTAETSSVTITTRRNGVVHVSHSDGPVRPDANVYGPKTFTPQSSTFSASDSHGRLESAYNYSSPGTYSWRFNVNTALCEGGSLQGSAVANVYNNGGLVPNTHYSKAGVSPCYGFHSSYPGNSKINTQGNYELSGGLTWKKGNATYNLDFVFRFIITLV